MSKSYVRKSSDPSGCAGLFIIFVFLLQLAFWGFIGFVAWHFISKFW